jgi:hypothetical protein
MSPLRLPRWTALLVLPLLAGALLLMHGLDPGASTNGLHTVPATTPTHAHQGETPSEHHDAGCDGCVVGHVIAACVAVAAAVVGLRLARRWVGTRWATLVASVAGRVGAVRALLRPPDPAWIRLAVMRC